MKRSMGFAILIITGLFMAGCGSSRQAAVETATAAVQASTSAAQTEIAASTATLTPSPTASPTITPIPVTPTETLTPTPAKTPLPCNIAGFIDDVTIPDGTEMEPGESFTKTWRLRNNGSCNWTDDYKLVFFSGDQMDGPTVQEFTTDWIYPGYEVDVSVDLVAPSAPGTYIGYWKLQNAAGVPFGLAPTSGPFYVEIVVAGEAPTVTPTPE
jgi:hypothetical protein